MLVTIKNIAQTTRIGRSPQSLFHMVKKVPGGGGVLIYFSERGRAAEQGIIFRLPTPGQGIIFVKIGSITGSLFVICDSERSF